MSCPHNQRIADLLRGTDEESETELFAILDAARDPRINRMLLRTPSYSCLEPRMGPRARALAPQLVRLRPRDTELLRDILDAGWGKSWGAFIVTRAGMALEELRRHLHGLLHAELPSGDRVLMRFYDPRVLRALVPTCSLEQLEEFFGPPPRHVVESFWMEGEDPDSLLRFRLAAGQLDEFSIALGG
jgi:hypothetical protein